MAKPKEFKIAQNKPKHLCSAWGCTKKSNTKDRFCSKHSHMYQKLKNPMRYYYNLLKSNSKKRKISFGLTFDEFKKFCDDYNYIELKGKNKNSISIDRINPRIGYYAFNIQPLTLAENTAKMHVDNYQTDDWDDLPF